tara:strand:- start:58 stop:372 length:315 start_codon:yes stop_codon:yes gene_type:complete
LIIFIVEDITDSLRKLIILLINTSTKTILYTMSEILDKLGSIVENIELLNKKIESTNLENDLLKNQQSRLVSEKSELLKKNEAAKMELKALLDRIDNIRDYGKN